MNKHKAVRRYLRAVSWRLCCPRAAKARLLDGLRQDLQEHTALDYRTLCDTLGPPAETAAQMLESVGPQERRRAKQRRRAGIAAAIVVLAVVAAVCGHYAWDKHMKYEQPGTTVIVQYPPVVEE